MTAEKDYSLAVSSNISNFDQINVMTELVKQLVQTIKIWGENHEKG